MAANLSFYRTGKLPLGFAVPTTSMIVVTSGFTVGSPTAFLVLRSHLELS